MEKFATFVKSEIISKHNAMPENAGDNKICAIDTNHEPSTSQEADTN